MGSHYRICGHSDFDRLLYYHDSERKAYQISKICLIIFDQVENMSFYFCLRTHLTKYLDSDISCGFSFCHVFIRFHRGFSMLTIENPLLPWKSYHSNSYVNITLSAVYSITCELTTFFPRFLFVHYLYSNDTILMCMVWFREFNWPHFGLLSS